ncbi:MAG TPA: M12 family metallo-peptidase [Gammaproteobacteria bacterium]|nr:M12 family metallo-peptidase [Gammaproteobacteria bacterium]
MTGVAAAADNVAVQYSEPLRDYAVETRVFAASSKPTAPGIVDLRFIALGREFVVVLEPNARLQSFAGRLGRDAGAAYRGKLAGRPDSWARIVLTPAGPAGLIADGSEIYALERADDSVVEGGGPQPKIYRLADVYIDPVAVTCAAGESRMEAGEALAMLAKELEPLEQQGAARNLDVGVLADFEFSTSFGSAASSALLTRINNVDGIFSEQVGVQITAAKVDVFTDDSDPFTKTSASALLDEVAVHRGETPAQDALGLTHLFTGKNLDGTTAGIAFMGGVCGRRSSSDPLHRSFAAALSEARRGPTMDSLVAAHEIGHTFGAPHDTEAGSACSATPPDFLMAPTISGSDRFSECSIAQMQRKLAAVSCLTPVVAPDLVLSTPQPQQHVPVGALFAYVLTVANLGSEPARASRVSVTLADGLQMETAPEGCSANGGRVDCALGDIAAGASRQVSVPLRADTPGDYAVSAAATSPDDRATGNNSLADVVSVLPIVDLALAANPGNVQANAQLTLVANVENRADVGASGVELVATLSPGLRAEQAAVAGAACTIAGQSITCPPQVVSPRGQLALTLTVTGVAAGTQQVSVTASSVDSDSNPADNSLAIAVNVSAPPEAGGGGALTWLSLLVLAAAAHRRRRPRGSAA